MVATLLALPAYSFLFVYYIDVVFKPNMPFGMLLIFAFSVIASIPAAAIAGSTALNVRRNLPYSPLSLFALSVILLPLPFIGHYLLKFVPLDGLLGILVLGLLQCPFPISVGWFIFSIASQFEPIERVASIVEGTAEQTIPPKLRAPVSNL